MVDARLPDGSRVNVAIRPVSIDGPLVSIRKFAERPFDIDRLIQGDTLSAAMGEFLKAAVRGRISLIISGGTGTGKTTLLNALSNYIPDQERLITIEDAAELQLQQLHSPMMIRSGRMRRAFFTRSRCRISPLPSTLGGRVSRRPTCNC